MVAFVVARNSVKPAETLPKSHCPLETGISGDALQEAVGQL